MTQNGSLKPIRTTYEQVYDLDGLGLLDKESCKRHYAVAKKLSEIPSGGGREWDPILCTLIVCVMMYSQDFIELDDAEEAERAQTMYAYVLQRYTAVIVIHLQ